MTRTAAGIALALTVALSIGVAAEFAELNQAMLIAIALPVLVVATWLVAAHRATPSGRAVAALAGGAGVGLALGTIGEGTYLALHYSRGGELSVEAYDSQRAMALALFVIHTIVGLAGGALVGAAIASWFAARGLVLRRLRTSS
jgi:hypothetical protein